MASEESPYLQTYIYVCVWIPPGVSVFNITRRLSTGRACPGSTAMRRRRPQHPPAARGDPVAPSIQLAPEVRPMYPHRGMDPCPRPCCMITCEIHLHAEQVESQHLASNLMLIQKSYQKPGVQSTGAVGIENERSDRSAPYYRVLPLLCCEPWDVCSTHPWMCICCCLYHLN